MPIRSALLFLAAGLAAPRVAADEALPRTELARRGKAAVALALAPPGGAIRSGPAFAVHPSGLFVTSYLVARPGGTADAPVRLVLNCGQPGQTILPARVLRADSAAGIAVVRVEGGGEYAALELGDSDRLSELTDMVGFSFRSGPAALTEQTELPAVTVSVASVSSLRRKAGVGLTAIQIEPPVASLNGGPMLGPDGKVAGFVVTGAPGVALPSNAIRRFLHPPHIALALPPIDAKGAGRPAEFRATATQLLPGLPTPELELTLDVGDGTPRVFPMRAEGGEYHATAAPLPPAAGLVGLVARFGPAAVRAPVADRVFTVGGQPARLSEVREVSFRPAPRAVRHDGTVFAGTVAGLDDAELCSPASGVRLDLEKADLLEFEPPTRPSAVTCTAVARAGGKEIGRVVSAAAIPALPRPAPAAPPEAKFAGEAVSRKLPEPFADVCMGGGGRYLLFLLPKLGRIALFDLAEAKIAHYFPAPDPETKFGAGLDKLVIALPSQGIVQRWSLSTFERELAVPFARQETIASVTVGHASRGPVLVNSIYLDLGTLRAIDTKAANGPAWGGREERRIASADGSVVGSWSVGTSPSGIRTASLVGSLVRHASLHESTGYVAPSPDGRYAFTTRGVYHVDLQKLLQPIDAQNPTQFLPAAEGGLYIGLMVGQTTVRGARESRPASMAVYTAGDPRPLAPFKSYPEHPDFMNFTGTDRLGVFKRIWLVPAARVLATLPVSNDTVELTRFDIDEVLERAGVDYFFLSSEPPTAAPPGGEYRFQLEAKSRRGGVRYKLDSGPPGLSVSPGGLIAWRVPGDFAGKEAALIVSAVDASGQEVFKAVTLRGVE